MEKFGALETKTQFSLLNNLDENSLFILCKRRGIFVNGFTKKYDIIISIIQWYNNIYYLESSTIRGCLVSECGPRKSMEDDYVIKSKDGISVYGVFDGHGGNYISRRLRDYCSTYLLDIINKNGLNSKNIKQAFLDIDKNFYNSWRRNLFGTDGSTASIVIGDRNSLYFTNAGDSRTVLYDENGVYFSTRDHKPTEPDEFERIENTRYTVQMKDVARIGGLLAVSRGFGDFIYKIDNDENYRPIDYAVSSVPDVTRIELNAIKNSRIKTVICATDGLWDVFNNLEVYNFIRISKSRGLNYKTIMRNLVNLAYERGSTDNITILLVEL
tara:strand:+ start:421 stop:1401 length:981 start_codon:yes stop_codon:yes gene_type:complete